MDGETPLTVYGSDGPVFERVCPHCRRFVKMPGMCGYRVTDWIGGVNEFWICGPKPQCKRCGPVEPEHVGWGGDYV